MVYIGTKHYYIFEPTRLKSGEVVIPTYFFKANGILYAKCCTPQYKASGSGKGFKIVIPADIKFSDHSLTTVDINEFDEMYSELYLDNNSSLADECGGKLFGQCLLHI
jgi:hypothetical protein